MTALTAASELVRDGHIDRWLVLAPKRVAHSVWLEETLEWEHLAQVDIVTTVGVSAKRRLELFEQGHTFTCCSFNSLPWLVKHMELFEGQRWGIIVDETTRLKQFTGTWAKAVVQLRRLPNVHIRWGLTGTPAPNRFEELYSQVKTLAGNLIWPNESFTNWRLRQFNRDPKNEYRWNIIPVCKKDLFKDISSIGFKIDESELPPLPEPRVIDVEVSIPAHVIDLHGEIMREGLIEVEDVEIEAGSAGVAAGKQHQMAQGFVYAFEEEPIDYEDENEELDRVYDPDRITIPLHTAKLDALQDLVESANGQPMLIFYEFQADVEAIRTIWPDIPTLGRNTSDADAADYISRWKRGELPLLAMHPASAGHGLNLQSGGHLCCWYGIPYSNELYQQAIKRLSRRGQQNRVIVYRIIARGTNDRFICDSVLAGRELNQQELIREIKSI